MDSKMSLNTLKAGDIGLSKNDRWLSKVIIWMESRWTGKANFSHVYAVIGDGFIVEAISKIKKNRFVKYDNQTTDIYRLPLSDKERESFRVCMLNRVGGAYGWFKYPGFVLDATFSGFKRLFGFKKPCFLFSKVMGFSNIPVCSQLVVWGVHEATSYRFKDMGNEVNWRSVNPDRFEDLLKRTENKAELIYSHKRSKA